MAFVVTDPDATTTGPDIALWCRDQMANYKAPRVVEIVAELPRNATGKVAKEELRARAASV
jgi:acyl-CoA synthetase (AMP-forming)/AMP-acid ligase II